MASEKIKPLVAHPLSLHECEQIMALLGPLVRYLGAPGDWGYGTRLGDATVLLRDLYNEVVAAGLLAKLGGSDGA